VPVVNPKRPPTAAERPKSSISPARSLHELPELRSENSATYLLSNGAYSQRLQNHPINFRTGDGSWQPIEDQLVQQPDGSWSPQAAPVADQPPRIARLWLCLGRAPAATRAAGPSSSKALAIAKEPRPDRSASIALRCPTPTSPTLPRRKAVREALTLASADAPHHLTTTRLTTRPRSACHDVQTGGAVLVQKRGRRVIIHAQPPPSASDANPRPSVSLRAVAVRYELSPDGTVLTLVLDKAWLSDPKRVFPAHDRPGSLVRYDQRLRVSSALALPTTKNAALTSTSDPTARTRQKGSRALLLYFDTSSSSEGICDRRLLSASGTTPGDTTSSPITIEAPCPDSDLHDACVDPGEPL